MLIAQITDCHVAAAPDPAKPYDVADNLARTIARLNDFHPAPALVVLTGDLADKRSREEYVRLAKLLEPLRLPLAVIPGNHDARAPMREVLGGMAEMGGETGFMHYVIERSDEHGPQRMIFVDTLEDGKVGGYQCTERLQWLEERLAEAPSTPTLIFMHHPPMLMGIPEFDAYGFHGLDAFRALIERSPQVDLILCGHSHRTITGRLGNATIFVSPATSCSYTLAFETGMSIAPVLDPPAISFHARQGPHQWISHVLPVLPSGA